MNFASLCFASKQKLLNRSEAKNVKRKKAEKSEKKRKNAGKKSIPTADTSHSLSVFRFLSPCPLTQLKSPGPVPSLSEGSSLALSVSFKSSSCLVYTDKITFSLSPSLIPFPSLFLLPTPLLLCTTPTLSLGGGGGPAAFFEYFSTNIMSPPFLLRFVLLRSENYSSEAKRKI